ncbi:AmmeMemoRadiSam system protein B [Acidobacteria bacterium AH-259-D05]|nr:AmmeMemoRadiSam system protein B [Acidobacteria bacterium AH-259-D05]
MSGEYPKLRSLEALPYKKDDQTLVALRDPSQISQQMLVVSPEFYSILSLFDGEHSPLDIQAELTRRNGDLVFSEQVQQIIYQLDEALLLDNDNFHRQHQELIDNFRKARVRPAFHSSLSYPAEPSALTEMISSFYLDTEGAGLPQERTRKSLRALVAPHIDLRLGGATYTHAYRALAECEPPDLFVILGTGHMGLPEFFSISSKDFETPLGRVESDHEFIQLFRERVPEPLFAEDLTHRHEHTIEFQILFLQHLFQNQPIRILPVLCSFSYEDVDPARSSTESLFQTWIEAFRRAEEKSGKRICVIASVDLAHMGPRYGDSVQANPTLIEQVSRKDHKMLEHVCAGQAHDFRDFLREERDQRKICGFSPLYTLLHLMEGQKAQLLSHHHSVMDPMGSFVTYASLIVEQDNPQD